MVNRLLSSRDSGSQAKALFLIRTNNHTQNEQVIIKAKKTPTLLLGGIGLALGLALPSHGAKVLVDFGSASTFRGVTSPGNWNSTGFGFISNLVDTTGAPTTIDWAPNGLGGVDSFNSVVGATSNPPTVGEISAVAEALNTTTLGDLGVAEAAIDYYVSDNGTNGDGRFQLQQLEAGQAYQLQFYASHRFLGSQTRYSVYDDPGYSNLLGSTTLTHGNGAGTGNTNTVASLTLTGPDNANNIFYIKWEGVSTPTEGYLNSMSIEAIPEPSSLVLSGMALAMVVRRRRA